MKHRIIKRNGEAVAVISYKDPITREYRQKWLTSEQYETEIQLERRVLDWMEDFESNDINNPSKITFGNFLLQWLDSRENVSEKNGLQQSTVDGYRIYIKKHIIPGIGNIPLQKLKPMDIDKFYKHMFNSTYKKGKEKKLYSQNTILQIHHIIHRALKYAWKNKLRKDNPADFIENIPQKERYVPNTYTETDFKKLIDKVKGTVDEIYIILAGCIGLRRGEVLGLKWNDIDFENDIIYVRKTKVRTSKGIIEKKPKNITSSRDISVNKKTIEVLKRWKLKSQIKSEYVCCEYNPNTYSGHFKFILAKYHLPHIRFHDLRHFAATFMLKSGISDKVAAKRLGHSNVATTKDIYQHVLDEMDREAADKLDKLF